MTPFFSIASRPDTSLFELNCHILDMVQPSAETEVANAARMENMINSRCIPRNILTIILRLAMAQSSSTHYYGDLLNLQLVCSEWTAVISSSPFLWSHIPSTIPFTRLQEIIQKAGPHLLAIHVNLTRMNAKVRQQLLQLAPRCQSLNFTADLHKPLWVDFLGLRMPHLKSIDIGPPSGQRKRMYDQRLAQLPVLFGGVEPRLEKLSLDCFVIPLQSLALEGLKDLRLHNTPILPSGIIDIISTTPHLEVLHISYLINYRNHLPTSYSEPVQLHCLEELVLGLSLELASDFLKYLRAPSLQQFRCWNHTPPAPDVPFRTLNTDLKCWDQVLDWTRPMAGAWKRAEWTILHDWVTLQFRGPMSWDLVLRNTKQDQADVHSLYERMLASFPLSVRMSLTTLQWQIRSARFTGGDDLLRVTSHWCTEVTTLRVPTSQELEVVMAKRLFPKLSNVEIASAVEDGWLARFNESRAQGLYRFKQSSSTQRTILQLRC